MVKSENKRLKRKAHDVVDITENVIVAKRTKCERDFWLKRYNEAVGDATEYAQKGNRSMVEFHVNIIKKYGVKLGNVDYNATISHIKQSIRNERDFWLKSYNEAVGDATEYAQKGNRLMMEMDVNNIKKYGVKLGNVDYNATISQIRRSFGLPTLLPLQSLSDILQVKKENRKKTAQTPRLRPLPVKLKQLFLQQPEK